MTRYSPDKLCGVIARVVLLAALTTLAACSGDDDDDTPPVQQEDPPAQMDPPDNQPAPPPPPQARFEQPPQLNVLQSPGEGCSGQADGRDLLQPQEFSSDEATGILATELVVRIRERCVPVWTNENGWEWQVKNLRTYGFPINHSVSIDPSDPDDPNIAWSAPGPTFILNAGSAPGALDGSRFIMSLHNYMPTQESYHDCDVIPDQQEGDPTYEFPNCFHGDNVTNFHFHGFHVSPQEHQDYVLLSLLPDGAVDDGMSAHSRGVTAIGSYDYDVAPLPWNQAPGTHWYHAHKHGGTALQVLNGLIGTFEVHGEFDAELESFYAEAGQELEERLMVIQQLEEQLPGLGGTKVQYPLVNGQANPVVRMRPGEIQRWRFVGATMQASAQLSIGFEEDANGDDPDPEVRQIAMDGVQFAPENYACQPILRGADCSGTTDIDDFALDPGNRIDILIKAPSTPGRFHMTHRQRGPIPRDERERIETRNEMLAETTATTNPPLLTLEVVPEQPLNMAFPTEAQFPALPGYLADLTVPSAPEKVVRYEMNKEQHTFNAVRFAINGEEYDPSCARESFVLGEPVEWTLKNNSAVAHPFHIHTNPFQLVSKTQYDVEGVAQVTQYNPPYIWMDTVAIPIVSTGDTPIDGEALIRYEAVDFTGEYVNHCHILGHEDRGMMQNVQATCPNGMWGTPNFDGSDECLNANVAPAPICE